MNTKSILMTAVAVLAMTSCMKDKKNEQTLDFAYSDNLSLVTDLNQGPSADATQLYAGADYKIKFDLTDAKATVEITNLQLTTTVTRMALKLEDVPLKIDETGAFAVLVSNYTSVAGYEQHTITNFKLRMVQRLIMSAQATFNYFEVSYTVDNQYAVRAVMRQGVYGGSTTVKDLVTGIETQRSEPYYGYRIDLSKMKGDISIAMLTIGGKYFGTLNLEGLDVAVSSEGIKMWSDSPVTPKVNGTADTSVFVSGIEVSGNYSPTLNVGFTYDGTYQVSASMTTTKDTPGNQQ